MLNVRYAIIPDDHTEPSAIFQDLEEAITWALSRHGNDRFRIRHVDLLPVEPGDRRPCTATAAS